MQIQVRPSITTVNPRLGGEDSVDLLWLSAILKDIKAGSSLIEAAKKAGTSYRGAWEKLNSVEDALLTPIIIRTKGHGSKLTSFGEFFLKFIDDLRDSNQQYVKPYQEILAKKIGELGIENDRRWRFASSSDAIIQQSVSEVKGFDLKIAGSSEALEKLLNNEADLAGYHVSDKKRSKVIHSHLSKNDLQIYPVMKRIQGLIVKKGNPLGIQSIADLTNPKVRFINRQTGSGTRLLLDSLLKDEAISPSEINGYDHEEFTHTAISNAILAGKADVGIGVKNIALENGLNFIPLKDEIFFVAMKKDVATQSIAKKLIKKIRSNSEAMPGYKAVSLNSQIISWI
ncbi:substrate-binding domain-containing protein [Polynucleobacter kasalickyi]|uniref:ModE molybdate transport repressor domain-containing protein n=1 Tax=Polynucleobacter kasalickyi TaxID=1938817 RepID=A0A1W2C2Q5_9BURK|nr:substrate-binding domain-containing protein [Polynucleobacter kasalickyi]SMC79386.1 ModE molybdate transport repressor domain-containing protein [Polynucleobacter kasalickyi]